MAFFITLSGVVTGYSHYDDTIAVTPGAVLRRIYPLYIFTVLFAVSYSTIPRHIAFGEYGLLKESLAVFARHALMLQSWFPADYFSFNVAGWFVSTILFLYLLTLPLLWLALRIRRTKRPVLVYCACIIALSLAAVIYCYALRNTNMEFTQYVLPVSRIWEYAIGICLGCLARQVEAKLPAKPSASHTLLFTAAEAAALALWIAAPYMAMPEWHLRIVHWLLPDILMLLAFTLGGGLVSRAFRAKPLVALGDLTFECFLVHAFIIVEHMKNNAFRQAGQARKAVMEASASGNAFNLGLCLLLTLLLAHLIHSAKRTKRD